MFANWPLYIDYTNWLKDRPSLNGFSRHTGIEVTYEEVIEGNEPFFQKIAPAAAGRPAARLRPDRARRTAGRRAS